MINTDTPTPVLDTNQTKILSQLLSSLNTEQKLWLGGYLTGLNEGTKSLLSLVNGSNTDLALSTAVASSAASLSIMYGTRSGNSQKVANKALKKAQSLGINAKLLDMNEYNPKSLKKEENIIIVVSTDGEGEPPVTVEEFYNFLYSKKVSKLEKLNYAVIGLGDKTYTHFCKIGKDIDTRLEELGAKRFFERIDCDLDFDEDTSSWISDSLSFYKDEILKDDVPSVQSGGSMVADEEVGTKEIPYETQMLDRINLNGKGATKDTYHIEFDIEDAGVKYQPGDALGVISPNDQALVDLLLKQLKYKGDEIVPLKKGESTIREAFINYFEISKLAPIVVKEYAALSKNKKLKELSDHQEKLSDFVYGNDLLDLVSSYPAELKPEELTSILTRQQARLYSIASSYNANPEEVHITVGRVEYSNNKRKHLGVCSNFLANLPEDENIKIFIDENIGFRLPTDANTPIIMIGAGTGIAPYRAFLQERALTNTHGKSWLFFGDRNFKTDFLYQLEWQKFLRNGVLNHMDVAFSRDQKNKVYVQHKLLARSKELYHWIREGAHIYLCGDKDHMANDVKAALLKIIQDESGYSVEKSKDYFNQLRREKRFQEDVY